MTRYEAITECEHEEWNIHATEQDIVKDDGSIDRDKVCRGAIRREVVLDYEAAHRAVLAHWDGTRIPPELIRRAVDAALEGG